VDQSLLSGDFASLFLLLFAVVTVAAVLRGFTGFGFGMFGVPLASLLMDPVHAVPIIMGLQLASGLITLRKDASSVDLQSVVALCLAGLPFAALGTLALALAPQNLVRVVIGLVTILASAQLALAKPAMSRRPALALSFAAGATSGFLHGLVAMGGPPLTVYYLSGWFRPAVARASMTFVFSALSAGPLLGAASLGRLSLQDAAMTLLLLPALIVGTLTGGHIFHRFPDEYKRVALVALMFVGLVAAGRGVLAIVH